MLTRYNKKTVTVVTEEGRQWNVSPNLLSRVLSTTTAKPEGSTIRLVGNR